MDDVKLETKIVKGENAKPPKRTFYTVVFTGNDYYWYATGILELTAREAFEEFQRYNFAKDFRIVEIVIE